MHLWSDLGKIKLSPRSVGQMTCLMIQMITRHKELSNELSWAQFGVEEGIKKLTLTELCLEAASLGTFWPVLGDLIFDRANELQIEKFYLGWKEDSKIFPKKYPTPNLDTEKASKSHLEKSMTHRESATHSERFSSVKFTLAQCTQRAQRIGKKGPEIVPNCLKFPMKPIKLQGRLHKLTCASNLIKIWWFIAYDWMQKVS